MFNVSQAVEPQATRQTSATLEPNPPQCCGQEMHMLLRRAVLHSDGSVVLKAAWGCRLCGRRIL
ncbi:MAG TPA: hypothetical protein VJW51_02930 [Candidatus Acidoferrales bacterium]|nr:hypothetical protein [Candidatus Acidoferrales bacterium]